MIFLSSGSAEYGTVLRYTTAGAVDTTFGQSGTFTTGLARSTFQSVALEADGSVVVGGYQFYAAGTPAGQMLVGHLTADGVADAAFGPDGTGFTVVQDGYDSWVFGVTTNPPDGGILVAGPSSATHTSGAQAVVARFTAPVT